jgi:MFS family permease
VSALPSSPRLRRILAAYTLNQLGTWFGTVALSVAVYDHTHSAVAVTALFVARFLPALAVPALVARVEASPRRGRLSVIYAIEGACAAALAGLVWHFWLPAILALVALDGAGALAASALLRTEAARPEPEDAPNPSGPGHPGALALSGSESPGARAHAARQADSDDQQEAPAAGAHGANAALNLALSISVVVGPTLAAVAVKALGVPLALLIDAASFLLCGALLTDLYPYVEERAGTSVRARLGAAWEYLRETPSLRAVLLTEAVALVFFETGAPAEVIYAKGTLNAGDLGYGTLLSAWGVGMVLGSLLFARGAKRSLGGMLTGGTFAVGVAYMGFAAAPSLGLAAVAALIGGVGNGVQWASLIGAVQQLTPQRLHGRLMGTVESIGALCPLIGLPLSGLVLTLGSPRIAFLVFGLAAAGATGGFLRLWMGWRIPVESAGAPARHPGAQGHPAGRQASGAEAVAETHSQREEIPLSPLEHPGTSGGGL